MFTFHFTKILNYICFVNFNLKSRKNDRKRIGKIKSIRKMGNREPRFN